MAASDETGVDLTTAERVARNEATFRDANEGIERAAAAYNFDGELLPFICECAGETCTEVVRVTLDEYEQVRAHPDRFLTAQGHHVNAQGAAKVVAETERYEIVEKKGRAAEVSEELDPRS